MASICLYDIDLLHSSGFAPPNLELMKIFNYHNQLGDIVKMAMPNEDFGRYNQIIYFKQSLKQKIPKNLQLSGENIQIYGYGFYKKITPLKNEIALTPPSYLPYYGKIEEKIKNIRQFRMIEKNSIIRVENNDFTGFKENCNNIYVADENFLYSFGAEDFINEYKLKYNIKFLHALVAKDEKTFEKFFSVAIRSGRQMVIDFQFSLDFFKKYYYENVLFSSNRNDNEIVEDFLCRIVKMILFAKNEQKIIRFSPITYSKTELTLYPLLTLWKDLISWSRDCSQDSFYNFYKNNRDIYKLDDMLNKSKNLRLIMKQNPKTFDTQNVDFW
jgi:hypothetical protein